MGLRQYRLEYRLPHFRMELLSVSERMTVGNIQRIGFYDLYINEPGFKFNTCVDHADPETTGRHREAITLPTLRR